MNRVSSNYFEKSEREIMHTALKQNQVQKPRRLLVYNKVYFSWHYVKLASLAKLELFKIHSRTVVAAGSLNMHANPSLLLATLFCMQLSWHAYAFADDRPAYLTVLVSLCTSKMPNFSLGTSYTCYKCRILSKADNLALFEKGIYQIEFKF